MRFKPYLFLILLPVFTFSSCAPYDLIIRSGKVVDGSGNTAYQADVGINRDKIKKIGNLSNKRAVKEIDASGLVVSPGFINVLSWANTSLLHDGRSMSDIKQGVTLEIFGEGSSPGPVNAAAQTNQNIPWSTLGGFLEYLENKGVSPNIASFVGATTVRTYVLGYENRKPTAQELATMTTLVKEAMKEGALGVGSSLIYVPAFFAGTDELIALCKAAAQYNGMYISHIRSEGNAFLQALDELITISAESGIPAEIYHLKAAGKDNWYKLDMALEKIDSARAAGLAITANMYTYTAASTGLDACLPPWTQEGGSEAWINRLKDSTTRIKILEQMRSKSDEWENFFLAAQTPQNIIAIGFSQDSLQYLSGKRLDEIALARNLSPEETIIDLIVSNGGDVQAVYFLMSEENVKKQLKLPYMSFGSDAYSAAAEGNNLRSTTHPRAYGTFARVLGKYVREEKVITLEEAVRKLSALAAEKLKIKNRGKLAPGYFADITIFDPATVGDKATFEQPHQYAEGMIHVFVNGVQVISNGEHTGAMPGKIVRGPGYKRR
jgi:N-acyl-D-amino-acid deacylase